MHESEGRVRIVENAGLRLRIHEFGPAAGSGSPLVLMLHGFPDAWFSFDSQTEMLVAGGCTVWLPEMRGYGESDRPSSVRAYGMDALVADVAAMIDASGADDVFLVGHDWGGAVAWEFARRAIRPLRGLIILNAPPPWTFFRELLRNPEQTLRSWYMLFFQVPRLPEWLLTRRRSYLVREIFLRTTTQRDAFPEPLLERYREEASRPGAMRAMLAYYRAAFPKPTLPKPRQARSPVAISVPTLVIWGERDTALSTSLLDGLDAHVQSLSVRRIPTASHWLQREQPECVGSMIAAFVRGEFVPEASALSASGTAPKGPGRAESPRP